MKKTPTPKNSIASSRQFYAAHPWQCRHTKTRTDVEAYVEASGKWETVLTVHSTSGATAETLANFVVGILNEHQSKTDLLHEAMMALELCLDDDHLTFSSEQVADRAITRIKARLSCASLRKA